MSTATDTPTARLEALGGMTAETESANPDPAQVQAEQAEAAQASEADISAKQWGMLMFTVGGFACMISPELKPVYSEERCFQWGQQANAVAEKRGWNAPANAPEIALVISTAGFLLPTFFTLKNKAREVAKNNPVGWVAKLGIWWRTKRAKAKAKAMTPAPEGGEDGRNE
jgi:hypothetical protein